MATTVEWLLSGPANDRWPDTDTCNGIAVACVGILLSADPQVARDLLSTLIPRAAPGLGRVYLLEQRIDAAARVDDLDDVNASYEELTAALEELADLHLSVAVLNNTATHLKDARAFDAAERILRSLVVSPDIKAEEKVAALINLATVLGEVALTGRKGGTRDIEPALLVLNEAHDLAESLHDPRLLGGVWFNRGFLYGRTGQSAEATRAYNEAAAAYEAAGGDPFDVAYVRRGQAAEAARNGRLDDAVNHFRVAAGLFMSAGHLDEAARTHVGLLMAMTTSGQPPDRSEIDNLLGVIGLTRPAEVPDLLMNMGNIVGIEDPDAALGLYRQAADVFAAQDRQRDVCRARHSQAAMIRRLGDPSKALAIMDDVKFRYVGWGLRKEVAEVDFNRALTLIDLEEYDQALDAALASLEELDRHRHTLAGPRDRAGIYSNTYPHLFDVALDLARRATDNDLVAALSEGPVSRSTLPKSRCRGRSNLPTRQKSRPAPDQDR